MLEKPDGADLLATAREVVLRELLPALPPDKAFAARMVANAIAIALREGAAAPGGGAAAPGGGAAAPGAVAPRDLAALAREIRAGTHDPGSPTHDAVRAWLGAYARARAAVSAPKALG